MKLLTKTSIYYLTLSLMLFLAGGCFFYIRLKGIIDEDFTENIYMEKEQILQFINDSTRIPQQSVLGGDKVSFSREVSEVKEQLSDTFLFNTLESEIQPYRQLVFPAEIGNDKYRVIISKPMFESDDLVEAISYPLFIIVFLMLALLFLLTRILSKKMWEPFYSTLELLNKFDIARNDVLKLPDVQVSEFTAMNKEIQKMTEKIRTDYLNLKEFTENASHEIQTPLAIIRSKLDLMIQSPNISEKQSGLLQDILESTNRLSKLNQSLLLLSKIENRQFHEIHAIDMKMLIENKLVQLHEIISFKNIHVEKVFNSSPEMKMNEQLAVILISNIISNSIKHNIQGGKIIVELNNHSFVISNTGDSIDVPAEKLFERFQKANPATDSSGLGLSIVKQICDTYGFKVKYSVSGGMHIIFISF
jgi:signal transduction histidine kinase